MVDSDKDHSSLKRPRYLFPLRNRSARNIAKIVNALFKRARLPQATDPNQTVEALWAYAALRAGIPASTLIFHLGHAPLGLPVLKLASRQLPASRFQISESDNKTLDSEKKALDSGLWTLDSEKKTLDSGLWSLDSFKAVGKIFLDNPPRWYAMSLRPGVRFTQVCRRIQLLSESSNSPFRGQGGLSLFYPSEEITRAIGKKIVTRQRPFIHSVVFFRARLTDIGLLFSKIGDLAWCYRKSAQPGAPYADISERQFLLFQQTIARFTPDYEVAPIGELELKEGDRVEILGGLFTGMKATVETPPASPGTVYRLTLLGDNGIDWRITVDRRLLKTT